MKKILILMTTVFATIAAQNADAQQAAVADWANYGRYAAANEALKTQGMRPEAVFMGNSITDGWATQHPAFFADNAYTGRGISGQVTAQMLARFRADVIDLAPRAVVILAGTNDIAQNQGVVALENIAGNIFSMAELALAHGIKPVICSVLPAAAYPWRPEITEVPAKVRALNTMLQEWAVAHDCVYVDYFKAMDDGRGGLPRELAEDGIHPTSVGYDCMETIIKPVLDRILK